MPLHETLLGYWRTIQGELFPWLEEEFGPLSERHKHLVTALEVARVEVFLGHWHGVPGHPPSDRSALARASAAKGEERPREKRRLERQADMSLADLLADLPRHLRGRGEAQRQGLLDPLDRRQAALGRGRRRHPDLLPLDLSLAARQPGSDPARHHDGGAGHQPLRCPSLYDVPASRMSWTTPMTRPRSGSRAARSAMCRLSTATLGQYRAASANRPRKRVGGGSLAAAWPRMSVTTSAAPSSGSMDGSRMTSVPARCGYADPTRSCAT